MIKVPFVYYWIRFYLWTPQMERGFHQVRIDSVNYYIWNAWLFSIQITDYPTAE